jgi:hypothetical protein
MSIVDHIRNTLIERILTINDKDYLLALDALISVSAANQDPFDFTKEQKLMLQMSENDIIHGRTIAQEESR